MKIIKLYSSSKIMLISLLLTTLAGCGGGGSSTGGGSNSSSDTSAVHCVSISESPSYNNRFVMTNNCDSTIILHRPPKGV